ncbi:CHAT domain-containing tetratricopeptide repeat protein [uncultured Dokdonia sp.]|uniref:CHAT domain-containing protein n=1 Tax=uncultured Dokdonia sp. TaxID=575653 RepID=UPI00263047AD|nr:CHAT domain-containing tetratricopeptide repeat protein [uncultured Dokdonia sp.]
MKYILLFFFSLSSFISFSQISVYNDIKKLSVSDAEKARKIDSLLQQGILKKDSANVEAVSYRYTNWHHKRGRTAEAIAVLPLSIKYHTPSSRINLSAKWRKLGSLHFAINNYEESVHYNKKAIEVAPEDARIYRAYQTIGFSHYHLSDFETAILNFEIAANILKKRKDYTNLLQNYIKASNAYVKKNTIRAQEKNLKNLLFADSISKHIPIDIATKIDIQRVLGIYYSEYSIRDTLKGRIHINKALQLAKKENDSNKVANIYNDFAILYDVANPKKSINYLEEGLKYLTNRNKDTKSFIYANLGLNNTHLGNHDIAIDQLYTSLKYLTGYRFDQLSLDEKKERIKEHLNDGNLWSILSRIAQTYHLKSETTQNKTLLDSALTYYKLTDYTFDLYQSQNKLTSSKFIWRKEAAEVYTRALRACLAANDIETGLNFMEKNKSLLLSEEIHRIKRAQKLNVPEQLILTERTLQNKIKSLQRDGTNDISLLKETIDSLEKVRKKINLSSDNTISYTLSSLSIAEIQQQIDPSHALLEYHIASDDGFGIYPNTNTGYGIVITKKEAVFFPIEKLQDFALKVEKLLLKNTIPFKTEKDIKTYQQLSYEVYKTLFPPSVRSLIESKELTIIPDDYLSKIPFESLIVSPNTSENDYLIYHHKIGYKYNYAFHEINRNNILNTNTTFSAFAPVEFTNLNLPKLTESSKETASLDSYFNGHIFSKQEASQEAFFNELGKSNLIHLATHADANDSIAPWIAFSDGKLFLDDISLRQNNASLVMLSACNSNAGEMVVGEGTMSLARGFFYGGAQSTISSLWNVDDKSTQYIVDAFYKNLQEGASKSSSLHQAKLDYLKNHTGSEVAPYYWASLVLIGDTDPLPQKDWFWYYIIVGSLIIVLLLLLSRKRKKQPLH